MTFEQFKCINFVIIFRNEKIIIFTEYFGSVQTVVFTVVGAATKTKCRKAKKTRLTLVWPKGRQKP